MTCHPTTRPRHTAEDIAAVGATAVVAVRVGWLAVVAVRAGHPLAAVLALATEVAAVLAGGRLCLRPEVRRRATMALGAAALPLMLPLLLLPVATIKFPLGTEAAHGASKGLGWR